MKILIAILLIFIFINVCNSQKKENEYIVIKITTTGNQDLYYSGSLLLEFLTSQAEKDQAEKETVSLMNSDVFVRRIKKSDINQYPYSGNLKLRIKTPSNKYEFFIGFISTLLANSDTISYVLNYDSLDYKQKELDNIQRESEYQEKKEIAIRDAIKLKSYFENQIHGRSHNQIADYLYDNGFSRSFSSSGSVFMEIYKFEYGLPLYPVPFTIVIKMWYSYGYGDLFYDVAIEL